MNEPSRIGRAGARVGFDSSLIVTPVLITSAWGLRIVFTDASVRLRGRCFGDFCEMGRPIRFSTELAAGWRHPTRMGRDCFLTGAVRGSLFGRAGRLQGLCPCALCRGAALNPPKGFALLPPRLCGI